MRRTKEQWQALIQAQAISGLSAADFCQQQGINQTYFSSRKHQLRQPVQDAPFVPAVKVPGTRGATSDSEFTLNYGACAMQFKRAPSAAWLAALIQALS